MHIVFDLIPFHIEARPVGAEYGVRGVVQIAFRVVTTFHNDSLSIVARGVAVQGKL